jgi:hypothetical protein
MGFLARLFQRDGAAAPLPEKLMSDSAAAKLASGKATLDAAMAANPGALPDFAGLDPGEIQALAAAQAAERHTIERAAGGVDAPGTIRSVNLTGGTDLGGGREVELEVTIQPPGGPPVDTRFRQHVLQAQVERLAAGGQVTVRYDPADPSAAVLVDW